MGTLAVSSALVVLCIMATPEKPKRASVSVAIIGVLSVVVFVARLLGFIVEGWGW